jgi:hypothetical protein
MFLPRFRWVFDFSEYLFRPIEPNQTPLHRLWLRRYTVLERFTLFYDAKLVSRKERPLFDRIFRAAHEKEVKAKAEFLQDRQDRRRRNHDW